MGRIRALSPPAQWETSQPPCRAAGSGRRRRAKPFAREGLVDAGRRAAAHLGAGTAVDRSRPVAHSARGLFAGRPKLYTASELPLLKWPGIEPPPSRRA